MSIKIYHGYVSKLNLVDLLEKFKVLVKEFSDLKMDLYSKYLTIQTVAEIDRKSHKNEIVNQTDILYKKHRENEQRADEIALKGIREPSLDFSASCSVFPINKNKTLILFYGQHPDVCEIWNNLDYVEEYHYQDQTDPPEDIPTRLWNKRRNEWSKALNDFRAPVENGYSFVFADERLPFRFSVDKKKHIPKKEKRVQDLMYETYIEKAIADVMAEKNEVDFKHSHYSEARKRWEEYKQTEIFVQESKKAEENLVKINLT